MSRTHKPTIGCRVSQAEMNEIDAIIQQTGESRATWLYNLIQEALGKTPAQTVQRMNDRITALERKLSRLAS